MLPLIIKNLASINKSNRDNNIVETTYFIRLIRKLAGASVITIEYTPEKKVSTTFSWFGFITFLAWYTSYYYCLYRIVMEDQSILRALYNTRLQHYGDDVERFTVGIFTLYAMWKVPFDLSGSTEDAQLIIDVDKALQDLNEPVCYSNSLYLAFILFLIQASISGSRIFTVSMSLHGGTRMPIEKIFQMIFADAIIFTITAQYCSYLFILKRRYRLVNRALNSIRLRTSSEFFKFRFQQQAVPNGIFSIKDKYLCKKIKACGRIYGMLFSATEMTNNKFGLVILIMMFLALLFTILYLYYFMEATASGLFHDPEKFIDFLIYVGWQIGFAISVMLVCIYFSEATVREAQITPHVIHQIINSDLGNTVETEAINLSLQILHQKPSFTAYGLFKLDYVMVLEGARSVTTFLVILLQFVTEKH
ncbi:putative gustatory receptor 28b [Bicyclus anynana]|uniref:Gustatory receptor n=1 Tax=Bicyclus anynana TaxID=110368 RepID=A0ABM3LHK5_BICAN|nr:putative gustatory receptor 28b [Bicyclus anynana]